MHGLINKLKHTHHSSNAKTSNSNGNHSSGSDDKKSNHLKNNDNNGTNSNNSQYLPNQSSLMSSPGSTTSSTGLNFDSNKKLSSSSSHHSNNNNNNEKQHSLNPNSQIMSSSSSSNLSKKSSNQNNSNGNSSNLNNNNNNYNNVTNISHSNQTKKQQHGSAETSSANKKPSVFTISTPNKTILTESNNKNNSMKKSAVSNGDTNSVKNENNKIKSGLSVLSLIIDNSFLLSNKSELDAANAEQDVIEYQIFDPEPASDDLDAHNQLALIDDRSFIDDDILDDEVAEINNHKISELAKDNTVFTVNEVPEGRLSILSSSRASSRSSIGSDSTRTSSFIQADQSDNGSSGLADMNKQKRESKPNSLAESSDSSSDSKDRNGSKNALLDALIRKFNVSMELDTKNNDTISETKSAPVFRQTSKHVIDDHKRKQSELQRKINRNNLEKQKIQTLANDLEENCNIILPSNNDDEIKPMKLYKSTGTQISRSLFNKNTRSVRISKLPQNFECRYLGKTKCLGLWGLKHIREPVDRLVRSARRLHSLEELPSVEALISEKGIYIVQKAKPPNVPNNNQEKISIKTNTNDKNSTYVCEKYYRSGLLPISNISYAVQDNLFSKVFSCIVVRERDNKTVSECYSFLCNRNDAAKRMALSITLAFKEYGKLLQLKETRISREIKLNGETNDQIGDSYA